MQHIRERSSPQGKENPADKASHGLTTKELLESSQWFNRPKFLWQQEPLPFQAQSICTLDLADEEIRQDSTLTLAIIIG